MLEIVRLLNISLCQPVSKQYWCEVRGSCLEGYGQRHPTEGPSNSLSSCQPNHRTVCQDAATPLVSLCNVKFQEMYNNIVIYIVGHPPEESPSPNEMHIFQCVNVSAR